MRNRMELYVRIGGQTVTKWCEFEVVAHTEADPVRKDRVNFIVDAEQTVVNFREAMVAGLRELADKIEGDVDAD